MALNPIQQLRLITQDNTPGLYIISDEELQYFLDKNNSSVARASIDAARAILMNLSMRTDDTVDILSIRSDRTARELRESLKMFLRDPSTNPYIQDVQGYIGGISLVDVKANIANQDNNTVANPHNEMQAIFPTTKFFDSFTR